jgi:hypothetical protein
MNCLKIVRGLFVNIRVTTRSIDSTHPNLVEAVRIQRRGTVPYGDTRVSKGPDASAGNTLTDPMAPLAGRQPHFSLQINFLLRMSLKDRGRDRAVGIATRYMLDDPGNESHWWGGGDFSHPSRPALGPTQPGLPWK